MRSRAVLWLAGFTALAGAAAWWQWGRTANAVATVNDRTVSSAEHRYLMSQSAHWRALALKR
jgi:hypothetical protein